MLQWQLQPCINSHTPQPASTRLWAALFIAAFFFLTSTAALLERPLQSLGRNINFVGTSFCVPGLNANFDCVIIGGGTAGLAIATRLAENATNSVSFIEAGGF